MQRKGIASRAIILCESAFPYASRWTTDFPTNQIANKRCYEKAGYSDTGDIWEQSNGRIVLAIYEKRLLAFRNIKASISAPEVQSILSAALFKPSPQSISSKIAQYQSNDTMQLYGFCVAGRLVGICGFETNGERVRIMHIAVEESTRNNGIGRAMVKSLQRKYGKPIEAETDDDAVSFYRKCGFKVTAIEKYNVKRWACLLPVQENALPLIYNDSSDKII
jgi:ribosomal protein S18 acetylase RimI-like enzyme